MNSNDIDNLDLTDHHWLCEANLNCFKLLYDSCTENVILINNSSGLLYASSDATDKKSNSDIDKGGSSG